ncbi:MAG: AAA family ATPase [Methanobacterium sp.]
MIIESLVMKNFKSHRNSKIEFNTGISIIMGGNGAGKSSILEAISFVLFKQHSGRKIEQLITIGQTKMSVEIEFISNGRKYRVLRQRSKNVSKAKIEISEGGSFQPLSSGDKQVTEEVQGLLEMDGDLFLNAVYVRQGEIADLVDKTPAEKKQVIGKLLGIESLEKAWKNMLPLMNQYEMKKVKLEGKLESLDGLNEEIRSKKSEKIMINRKVQEISATAKKIELELDAITKQNNTFEESKSIFEKTLSNIEAKNQVLEKLQVDHDHLEKQINEIKTKENEMELIKPKLSKLEVLKKLNEQLDKLKTLQTNKKQINDALEKITKFKTILKDNKNLFEDYLKLEGEISDLEEERVDFEGSRELMRQNQTRKEQTLNKMNLAHEKLVNIVKKYNKSLGTEFSLVEELGTYLRSVKPELSQKMEILDNKIIDSEKELSNLKMKNKELTKPIGELEHVKDKCPVCKSEIDSNKRMELIKEYSSQIEINENRIIQLNNDLNGYKSEKDVIEERMNSIQSVNIELLNEQLKNLEEGQKELIALKGNINELEGKVSVLNRIDGKLNEKKDSLKKIKPNYQKYLVAEGSLNSIGKPDELLIELEMTQGEEDVLKENISCLIEVTGGSVENLETEIKYLQDLDQKYQQLSGAVTQKSSLISRMEEVNENLDEENTEISRLISDLNEVDYNEEIHFKIKEELRIKNLEFSDLIGKKQELLGKESGLDSYLEELEIKLESYKSFQKEVKNLKDFLKLLTHIRDIYGKDGVQKDLRNISRPLIEENTRDFFEKFNFEYTDIKLDDDYDITVYGPAGESSLDMISGGEKIAVALALRLGITQTLSGGNLELIMLDEPTIHLDAYRRQELIELLKRMSIIPQMIIVTHDPDLEEAADHIYRVKKDEGKSIISNS